MQSTLPMYPTVLGHADSMRAAVELVCGSSQGTTRGVPVLQGQEVAFLSAKGDRTVANGSFWGAHRLVYAVVPQSSGATWSGSSGDFEAEAAAATAVDEEDAAAASALSLSGVGAKGLNA